MDTKKTLGSNESKKESKEKDMVNHPDHYNQNSMEHADFVEYMGYPYTLGCATKYVFRNRFKGSQNQDLDKVVAYCELYLKTDDARVERMGKGHLIPKSKLKGLTSKEIDLLESIDNLFVFKSGTVDDEPTMQVIRDKVKSLKV